MNEMKKFMDIVECGYGGEVSQSEPTSNHRPMSMTINMNAEGADQVNDLIDLFSAKGKPTKVASNDDDEVGFDMDTDDSAVIMRLAGVKESSKDGKEISGGFDSTNTSPDQQEYDLDSVIRDGDDMHRTKRGYAKSQDGDNPMAVKRSLEETFKDRLQSLYKQIKETSKNKRA